jgi:hypothetical protein
MSTPAFVPQDANSLTQVRYYTALDPYYYSVDNRPLQDLATNITTISSGGGDSARRSVLLTELALSSIFQELFQTANVNGFVSGLNVSYPAPNTLQIGPGALYQTSVINANIGTPVIKQGLLLAAQQFTLVFPSVPGQSINYLIEAQYQDLSTTNMQSSPLPFLDSTNQFLPCLLLNGQVSLQLKAGVSAPTSTQTTPTPDPGWTPLYVVTVTYGVANPVVVAAQNAPSFKGMHKGVNPVSLPSGGATTTAIAGISTLTFQKSGTEGVALPIPLRNGFPPTENFPNPYKPINFKFVYSSDVSGGNFAMQIQYLAVNSGGSTGGTYTSTAIEAIPISVSANAVTSYNTAVATIPSSSFSGFLNNVWAVTAQKLFVQLQRVPGNAADTATGNLFLHDVIVYQ